jgi:hypothetical protein
LLGLSFDFKAIGAPGLSAFANYAKGNDARDPQTGESLPDQTEVDLTVDYRFPSQWAPGLWIRLRGSILDLRGEDEITNFRAIINYDVPVF